MRLYLDVIFFINVGFDFILLLGVSVLLKRNVKITRIILGSVFGGLSIFFLFLSITSVQLFFLKVLVSVGMILATFGYHNLKYLCRNLFYLYTSSMVLGGALYVSNVQFSYQQVGLVFYHNGLSINVIVLLISSPVILYTYIKQAKLIKQSYAHYYKVGICINEAVMELCGFVDTGNKLKDPYFRRPIILINKNELKINLHDIPITLVPYHGVNHSGLLSCVKPDRVEVEGIGIKKKVLVGLLDDDIVMDGITCILNEAMMEAT